MIVRLWKSPFFIFPFILLVALFSLSVYYDLHIKETVPEPQAYMDANGDGRLQAAPYPPSERFPMGTDKTGFPLHYKILEGAKYTIGLAFVITSLRMILSLFFGLTLRRFLLKIQIVIKGLTNSFSFVPLSLIAYFLLSPVLVVFSWSFESKVQLIFSISVLTLLAVPTLTLLISSETDQIMKEEFIDNSRILGGSYFHVLSKHVRPYLVPRLFIMFNQQMIQVLLIFAHLGVLGMFIGGTDFENVETEPMAGNEMAEKSIVTQITSLSSEWGGLVAGATKSGMLLNTWQLLYPGIAFGLTILAYMLMLEGVKRSLLPKRKRKKYPKPSIVQSSTLSEEHDFKKVSNQ
ncbi:hypothetical protein ACSVDE_03375 [Pseudalkalibacillus sp. Hm43]|uniref:hypothetical protein n=1 Tax=Pseudalkalibacillus sp. Hm43 TaxID=3450742 RepID=UPI003F43F275